MEEFEGHVRRLHANDYLLFSQEYATLRPASDTASDATLAQENRYKNRYNNIVAYDHSRVKLIPTSNVPGSDYINANYLDGYNKEKAYIATQGPLPDTTEDFWRMVWEQNSKIIVMVSKQTRFTADGPLLYVNLPYSTLQKSLFKFCSVLYVFCVMQLNPNLLLDTIKRNRKRTSPPTPQNSKTHLFCLKDSLKLRTICIGNCIGATKIKD